MVAPNAKLDDGSECQYEDTALNAKLKKMMALNDKNVALNIEKVKRWWLWVAKLRTWRWLWMSELRSDDGSERRNWKAMMALNTKTDKQWWLWTPELRSKDGSERQNWKAMVTLNTKTEKEWWLWTPKLRGDDDSECRNWEAMMTLNAETEKRWWL